MTDSASVSVTDFLLENRHVLSVVQRSIRRLLDNGEFYRAAQLAVEWDEWVDESNMRTGDRATDTAGDGLIFDLTHICGLELDALTRWAGGVMRCKLGEGSYRNTSERTPRHQLSSGRR